MLSKIRRQAAQDLSHIPNFTCLETIERSTKSSRSKPFGPVDVVQVEVVFLDGHEQFAWPGETSFQSSGLKDILGTGMASTGEFVAHPRSVFVANAANIHYSGTEDLGGRPTARYDYEISSLFSGYRVSANGASAIAGVRGSFWADSTTFTLLRLNVEGVDIPSITGVRSVRTEIDYGRLPVGSNDFLLPTSAVTSIAFDEGRESHNRIDYTHCRQYSAESVFRIGQVEMQPPNARISKPSITEFTIPPNLLCSLRLQTPIRLNTAKIGDAISSVLEDNIKYKGRLIAPQGANVSGRLRLLDRTGENDIVGIELTDLHFEGTHARFLAKLTSVDARFASLQVVTKTQTGLSSRSRMTAGKEVTTIELPPDVTGVGIFFISGHPTELPKGMLMEWKTLLPSSAPNRL